MRSVVRQASLSTSERSLSALGSPERTTQPMLAAFDRKGVLYWSPPATLGKNGL